MTMPTMSMFMQDGSRLDLVEVMSRLGILLVVYGGFTAAQRYLVRNPLLRRVGVTLNLLALALLTLLCLNPVLNQMHAGVRSAVAAAAVFMGVIIGLRLFDVFLFERLASWRGKPPTALVVRDLGRWLVSAIALVMIVRAFFPDVNLSVLAVSSLVAGYIVGNATQDTLGNLVAGLALNTETPFQIGDWVTVGGNTGVVVNTTWRATTLRTKAEDHIIIPNASIAREPIINYSRPTRCHGCYSTIGVDYDTPPNKVRQVILDVLNGDSDILKTPPPSVFLAGYGDFAVNFTIKFFIEDYGRLDPIQSRVMDRLWYTFKRAGIGIPYPIRDVRLRSGVSLEQQQKESQRRAALAMLDDIELFSSLSEAERARLADTIVSLPFACGEALCREGEPGDSFYIIRSGQVTVSLADPDGQSMPVAQLGAGGFFGEMSLLTGETRSATARAETDVEAWCVSKKDFAGLLKADIDLAGKLAAILEKRGAERRAKLATSSGKETAPLTQSTLVTRIRRFFNLA